MTQAPASLPYALLERMTLALALVVLPHALHTPPWIMLLAGASLLWRMRQLRGKTPLPSRSVLLILLGVGITVTALTHGTLIGLDGGVSFLVLLTGLKLLEVRKPRDAGITLLLGLFLLLTLFLFDQGPLTALWALACFILLISLLSDLASGLDQPLPLRQHLLRLLPVFARTLPFAVLLFLLVPRPPEPLFGLPQPNKGTTGLSDELAPGSITDLSRSTEVVFRATFSGEQPEREELYWRGPVFWDYDGRRWKRLPDLPQTDPKGYTPGLRLLDYELMIEPQPNGILPALDRPVSTPDGARMLIDQDLRFIHPQSGRRLIRLQSSPDAILAERLPEALRRKALALPTKDNPLLLELGRRWQALPPRERIVAALRMFREQPFRYTLQPPALPEQDSMDAFLFDTRAGFCEHYATSFVLLMRAAGLPARVITGYQGGEYHPNGYWLVRQGDAHAWAEVWLEGQGWVRIDPTKAVAPKRIHQNLSAAVPEAATLLPAALRRDLGLMHRLWLQLDGLENRWNRWVLGYGLDDQRRLLEWLGWAGSVHFGLWLLTGFGMIALLALILLSSRLTRTQIRLAVHQRHWQRIEQLMGNTPLARRPAETPRAWATRLRDEGGALGIRAASVIEAYLAWRYAPSGSVTESMVDAAIAALENNKQRTS